MDHALKCPCYYLTKFANLNIFIYLIDSGGKRGNSFILLSTSYNHILCSKNKIIRVANFQLRFTQNFRVSFCVRMSWESVECNDPPRLWGLPIVSFNNGDTQIFKCYHGNSNKQHSFTITRSGIIWETSLFKTYEPLDLTLDPLLPFQLLEREQERIKLAQQSPKKGPVRVIVRSRGKSSTSQVNEVNKPVHLKILPTGRGEPFCEFGGKFYFVKGHYSNPVVQAITTAKGSTTETSNGDPVKKRRWGTLLSYSQNLYLFGGIVTGEERLQPAKPVFSKYNFGLL